MHTPAWLLRIVISYLSDRSMFLTYNGAKSSRKLLPGGGPQGAYLGCLILIIKYNGAFLRPPIPRQTLGPLVKSKAVKVKFVDDGTVAVSINLKDCIVPDPATRPRPLNFHERTGHILPEANNMLQHYITDNEEFVAEDKMQMNKKKTKVISVTKSRKWDFPPELHFGDGTPIECIPDTKLVGVIISHDLKWTKNTSYICQKARNKLWMLRRLLKFDLDIDQMFDVYIKEIRSILEMAVPVWHGGLTKLQSSDIEHVQKVAMQIILQNKYVSYKLACKTLKTKTLEERRTQLCQKFATKNLKSPVSFFTKLRPTVNTRQSRVVRDYKCNNKRYKKSSMPILASLLNKKLCYSVTCG